MALESEYLKKLTVDSPDVAARYRQKIMKIGGVDPFCLGEDQLTSTQTSFPPVTNMDIVSYLVLTTSFYTKQQMKAFKSLGAYKYFEAGFVHQCRVAIIDKCVVVRGSVKHSQKMNEPPVQVWIICSQDGSVETAHCRCMAGAGEVCSHIGAVLYALEYVHSARQQTSCTDVSALWNVPKANKVSYAPLNQMNFGRVISSCKLNSTAPAMDKEEMVQFFKNIEDSGSTCTLMRVVEPFASAMVKSGTFINNPYTDLYKPEFEDFSYHQLVEEVSNHCDAITLSPEECKKIEVATRTQSRSNLWFHQRAGRITASNFKSACRTSIDKPSLSLIKLVCYPTNFLFRTKATMWGAQHEKVALLAYEAKCSSVHSQFRTEEVGLCLMSQYPQFGASPDALVKCECCGTGCVEIKCPYLLRNMTLEEFIQKKNSCLTCTDGNVMLNRGHAYFYQVQMQMAITGCAFCDFVVWSPAAIFIERIPFNEDFWMSESQKAIELHSKVILPELLGRSFTRNDIPTQTWCICGGIDDGRPMLCCDNDECLIKWHHLECVGFNDVPEGQWFCNACMEFFIAHGKV